MKIDFKPAVELINKSQKIGLITHVKADGDAMGSTLAMRDALQAIGKEVIIFSNEDLDQNIKFLEKTAKYFYTSKYESVDLLIVLDLNTEKRTTVPEVVKEALKKTGVLQIDHHEPGDLNDKVAVSIINQKTSSTAEIVYWLIVELGVKVTRDIAEYILLGIETDTNFLSTQNAFESTHQLKEVLIKLGARSDHIIERIKECNVIFSNDEFKETIDSRTFENKNGVVVSYVTREDHKKFGIEEGISSIVSNYLDHKHEAKIVMALEERDGDKVKVSMRSNKSGADVSKLASFFGGGGHKQAAGFEYQGKLSDLLAK